MLQFLAMAGVTLAVAAIGFFAVREKLKADRRLRDAISVIPTGLAFYDDQDRLYLWRQAL